VNDSRLQRALRDAAIISESATCRTVTWVSIEATGSQPPIRMDLTVDYRATLRAGSVDLKHGRYVLLAQRGKPAERLNRVIGRVVTALSAQHPNVPSVCDLDLRVIARMQPLDIQPYHLLADPEASTDESGIELRIATWDGFLAKLDGNQNARAAVARVRRRNGD
jgi:hypothetical protein